MHFPLGNSETNEKTLGGLAGHVAEANFTHAQIKVSSPHDPPRLFKTALQPPATTHKLRFI